VHRPVSEPLLELRAPLVRHLLQEAEPAPRLVPLTLLLELRGSSSSLTARRSEAACWFVSSTLKSYIKKTNYFGLG